MTDHDRKLIAEHLNEHLTDGKWHDDCPHCLDRRRHGGLGIPAECVLTLLTDLNNVQEGRRVLREALENVQYNYYPASRRWYCVDCNVTQGDPHKPDCRITNALLTTKEKPEVS